MTEIKIQQKERRAAWPWVALGAILLVLLVWWLARDRSPDELATTAADTAGAATAPAGTSTAAGSLPTAVEVFLQWADDGRADSAMGRDHEYTATGIRHLASALEALAAPNAGANVQHELATLRAQADTLQQNPASTRHADYTRRAFVTLGALMSAVQQQRFPNLQSEVAEVRRAAEAVRADQPLLDQRARVHDFFDRAAAAVRPMSAGGR